MTSEEQITFTAWLRVELGQRQMSQRELAGITGLTEGALSRIMQGNRAWTADLVLAVSVALGVQSIRLLGMAGFPVQYATLPREPIGRKRTLPTSRVVTDDATRLRIRTIRDGRGGRH